MGTSVRTMAELTRLDELTETPHAEVFADRNPRTVRLQLDEGDAVPAHSHPRTTIVCHVMTGELALALDGDVIEASAGDVVRFSGNRQISPRARSPTTALLVFVPA